MCVGMPISSKTSVASSLYKAPLDNHPFPLIQWWMKWNMNSVYYLAPLGPYLLLVTDGCCLGWTPPPFHSLFRHRQDGQVPRQQELLQPNQGLFVWQDNQDSKTSLSLMQLLVCYLVLYHFGAVSRWDAVCVLADSLHILCTFIGMYRLLRQSFDWADANAPKLLVVLADLSMDD
jgi:hypothetical protein